MDININFRATVSAPRRPRKRAHASTSSPTPPAKDQFRRLPSWATAAAQLEALQRLFSALRGQVPQGPMGAAEAQRQATEAQRQAQTQGPMGAAEAQRQATEAQLRAETQGPMGAAEAQREATEALQQTLKF